MYAFHDDESDVGSVHLGAVYVLTIFYLPSGLMGIPERIRRHGGALGKREKLTTAS